MPITSSIPPGLRHARLLLTLLVAAFVLADLAWQWAHGGIVSHHLLADPGLPAVSNGWGIVALPALAWLLSGRFMRRASSGMATRSILIAAIGSAVAGICLSLAFSWGTTDHASLVLLAMLLCGAALPIHRAECLLGFVLAMAWTFGPVLPILIGAALTLFSVVVRRVVWPALTWATSRLKA